MVVSSVATGLLWMAGFGSFGPFANTYESRLGNNPNSLRTTQSISKVELPASYVVAYRLEDAKEFEVVKRRMIGITQRQLRALQSPRFVVRPINEQVDLLCFFGAKADQELQERKNVADGFRILMNGKKPMRLGDLPLEISKVLRPSYAQTGRVPNEDTYLSVNVNLEVDVNVGENSVTLLRHLSDPKNELYRQWTEILKLKLPENRKANDEEMRTNLPRAMEVHEFSRPPVFTIDPNIRAGNFDKVSKVLQEVTRVYFEVLKERQKSVNDFYETVLESLITEQKLDKDDRWIFDEVAQRQQNPINPVLRIGAGEAQIVRKRYFGEFTYSVSENGVLTRHSIDFQIVRKPTPEPKK